MSTIATRIALAAGLAFLAVAPAALAETVPPDRADRLGGVNEYQATSPFVVPDHQDGWGGANQTSHISEVVPPDRADALGSANEHTQQYVPTTLAAPTVIVRSAGGFDWTAALAGALAAMGICALALGVFYGASSRRAPRAA